MRIRTYFSWENAKSPLPVYTKLFFSFYLFILQKLFYLKLLLILIVNFKISILLQGGILFIKNLSRFHNKIKKNVNFLELIFFFLIKFNFNIFFLEYFFIIKNLICGPILLLLSIIKEFFFFH
jgi:hypothetical protein